MAAPDLAGDQVRAAMLEHLGSLFAIARDRFESRLQPAPSAWPSETRPIVQALYRDVDAIIAELSTVEALDRAIALKSFASYSLEHAVETAVLGIMIGKRLAMPKYDLRQLGLACLLHDLGDSLLPPEVLSKAGPLSETELAQLRRHPRAGYELIASLRLESTAPQQLAWQHHERQDGHGYPRGLHGTNRVHRSRQDLATPGRIMLFAEVAAVADVYSALMSDRPYRPAYPPDQVVGMMREMSGEQLNREVVEALFTVVPTFPVGQPVVVSGGQFDGWRGVVCSVRPFSLHRPVVRLTHDPNGTQVEAGEIDLAQLQEAGLTAEKVEGAEGG